MEQLITFTEKEQYLASLGFTTTLKEIADKYGKRHDTLMKDFRFTVELLPEEHYNELKFELLSYPVEKNDPTKGEYTTYELDLKATLWFLNSLSPELRHRYISETLNDYILKQEKLLINQRLMQEKLLLEQQQILLDQQRILLEHKAEQQKIALDYEKTINDYKESVKIVGLKRPLLDYEGLMFMPRIQEELHK